MQSILQYRKFGLAVQAQLSRQQEAVSTEKSHQPAPPLPPASESPQESASSTPSSDSDIESIAAAPTRTHYSARTALGHALTGVQARDRTTHEGKGAQVFVVDWEGERDALNPRNWSLMTRLRTTLVVSSIAFVVGAASSVDTAVSPQASAAFGVSDVVESLATGKLLLLFS
jgi:hypothetical protein